jgi:hypothetical protein
MDALLVIMHYHIILHVIGLLVAHIHTRCVLALHTENGELVSLELVSHNGNGRFLGIALTELVKGTSHRTLPAAGALLWVIEKVLHGNPP